MVNPKALPHDDINLHSIVSHSTGFSPVNGRGCVKPFIISDPNGFLPKSLLLLFIDVIVSP